MKFGTHAWKSGYSRVDPVSDMVIDGSVVGRVGPDTVLVTDVVDTDNELDVTVDVDTDVAVLVEVLVMVEVTVDLPVPKAAYTPTAAAITTTMIITATTDVLTALRVPKVDCLFKFVRTRNPRRKSSLSVPNIEYFAY